MRRNIVIIDDEIDIGYLLKSNIGSDQFDVHYFQDLKSGISALIDLDPLFLFLDVSFPDGNGLDSIDFIKSALPNCIILVISAHDENSQAKIAIKAGADGFIPKPFSRDIILDRIKELSC